jgi:hypothetical protein
MAKQVLLNFLLQKLGPYVDGLSKENLRVGLFSGNLELKNLSLKAEIFDSLHLPIRLVYGTIKSIEVSIPWMNLGKNPVVVNINGVLLHVEFDDENRHSAEELEEITLKLKRDILEKSQRRAFSQACSNLKLSAAAYRIETAKHHSFAAFIQTYLQRIITKLLFNVEAVVTNIHLRFTDKVSSSETGQPKMVAAGVTIQTLSLVTPTTPSHSMSSTNLLALCKVTRLENLSIYWDCQASNFAYQDSTKFHNYKSKKRFGDYDDDVAASFDLEEWETGMMNVIAVAANNTSRHFLKNCLVSAPNLFEFHIKHHPSVDNNTVPKLEVSCDIMLLKVTVDQSQLEQIVDILRRVAVQQNRLNMTVFRPQQRPTEDARGWWIYAYQLVTGREDLIHKYRDRLQTCMQYRDRYIDLVMKSFTPVKTHEFLPHDPLEMFIISNHVVTELKDTEVDERRLIERLLPIQALIVYQNLAMEFLVRKEFTELTRHHEEGEQLRLAGAAKHDADCCWPRKAVMKSAISAVNSVRSGSSKLANSTSVVRGSMMRSLRSLMPLGVSNASQQSTEIPFEEIARAMEAELEASETESRQDVLLLRCNFNIRMQVTVTVSRKVVLETVVSAESCSTFYSQTHICCTLNITELFIEEKMCPSSRKPVILALYKQHRRQDAVDEGHVEAKHHTHADFVSSAAKGTYKALANISHHIGDFVKEVEDETVKGMASLADHVHLRPSESKNSRVGAVSGKDGAHRDSPTSENTTPTGNEGFGGKAFKSIKTLWSRKDGKDSPTNGKNRKKLWMETSKDSRVYMGSKTTRSQRMLVGEDENEHLIRINYEYNAGGRSSVQIAVAKVEMNINVAFLYLFAQEFAKTFANLKHATRSFWSGDFVSQAPQCSITTSKSSGKSTVQITDAISDRDTNIFKKYFHKLLTSLRFLIGEHLAVEVAVLSPKIYIDSNFASDTAFAVVDIGSVAVTGFISVAARNFELTTMLSELSVSCGPSLPTLASMNRESALRKERQTNYFNDEAPGAGLGYLVHPLTINAKFSNTDVTSSDGLINVSVEGFSADEVAVPVKIELDTNKTIQLMKLTENVLDVAAALTAVLSRYPIILALPEANLFDHFADKVPVVHHLRNMVTVEFICKRLVVIYNYPAPTVCRGMLKKSYSLELDVGEMRGVLNQRLFDTKLLLVVATFALKDTYRPFGYSTILAAQFQNDSDDTFPLIHLTLSFGSHKKTNAAQAVFPDFEAGVSFERLNLNVDAHLMFHVGEILNPVIQYMVGCLVARHSTDVMKGIGITPKYDWLSTLSAASPQLSHSFVTAAAVRHTRFFEKDVVKLSVKVHILDVTAALVDVEEEGGLVVVPICQLHMESIEAGGNMSKGVPRRAHANVSVVEVFDCRGTSREFFYKKVVGVQQASQKSEKSEKPKKTDLVVAEYSNQFSNNDLNSSQLLSICISGVQINACVDVILDISSTLVGIAFACIHLVSPVAVIEQEADTTNTNGRPVQFRQPGVCIMSPTRFGGEMTAPAYSLVTMFSGSSRLRGVAVTSNFKLKCTAYNTSMILLADPMVEASASLQASYMAELVMVINDNNMNDSASRVTSETVTMSITNVYVGFISDTGSFLRDRCEDPATYLSGKTSEHFQATFRQAFSVDCVLRRELKQTIPVAAEVIITVGDVDMSVSVNNLRTAAAMIGRSSLAGLSYVSPSANSVAYCIWGSHNAKEERVMYSVTLNTGRFVVEAVSETIENGFRVPNLRFTVSSVVFHLEGALHPRIYVDATSLIIEMDIQDVEGSGEVSGSMEFCHPVAKQWESVIDPFEISVDLAEMNNEVVLAVNISDGLKLNLSGAVIETMLYQYSKLLWFSSRGTFVNRDDIIAIPSSSPQRKVDLVTRGMALLEPYRNNAWSRLLLQSVPFRQKKASLTVQHPSNISMTNAFMSTFKYVLSFSAENRTAGELGAGDSFIFVVPSAGPGTCKLALKLGTYDWTNEITLNLQSTNKQEVVIKKGDKEITRLVVEAWDNRSAEVVPEGHFEIVIYAVAALIDCSGFGVSAMATVNRRSVVRATHLATGIISHSDKVAEITAAYKASRTSTAEIPVWESGYKSQIAPQSLSDLRFDSQRNYTTATMKLGRKVYTDRSLVWSHIPPIFRKQLFFQTACDDYGSAISNLIVFTCSFPVFVFVMVDSAAVGKVFENSSADYHWLQAAGFVKTQTTLVASQRVRSETPSTTREDRHFIPFGKLVKEGETLTLGSAGFLGKTGLMYSVCVVQSSLISKADTSSVNILYSVLTASGLTSAVIENCWVDGNMGLCSVHSDDNTLSIGFVNEDSWSPKFKLHAISADKQYVELDNLSEGKTFQLSCQITRMPGLFFRTAQVKIVPYYCILNCADEYIEISQALCKGTQQSTAGFPSSDGYSENLNPASHSRQRFVPYESGSWHKTRGCNSSLVRFKTESSRWSLGGIDINEVGSSVIYLVPENNGSGDGCILHVDVKLADENDCCAVAVIMWKESMGIGSSLSVSNETNFPLAISQADLLKKLTVAQSSPLSYLSLGISPGPAAAVPSQLSEYTIVAPPKARVPFGWADPSDCTDAVLISNPVFSPGHNHSQIFETAFRLEILTLNQVNQVNLPGLSWPVFMTVQARGNGKVIRVANSLEDLGHGANAVNDLNRDSGVSSSTATGAVAAGAVIGTLLMGPIGTVLVGGGTYVLISRVNADARAKLNVDLASLAEERARELLTTDHNNSRHVQRIRTKNFDGYSSNINISVSIAFSQLSVSLFVEKPERREFLTLYVDNLQSNFKFNAVSRSTELSIQDVQLDSYSETAIAQSILRPRAGLDADVSSSHQKGKELTTTKSNVVVSAQKVKDTEQQFFHCLLVEEFHPEEDTVHYKYIGFRMLELCLSIDSASIQLLATDLGVDFSFLAYDQEMATHAPKEWVESFNFHLLNPTSSNLLASVRQSQLNSLAKKIFIENFVIHPIKLTVTFAQTTLPRKLEQLPVGLLSVGMLSFLPSFAAIDNATIYLESFIVCNVMESLPTLTSRVLISKLRDLQYQLAPLVGSLTAIGGPVGLVKKVGGGVQGLVYEVSTHGIRIT